MKISALVKQLTEIFNKKGDIQVVLLHNSRSNSFSPCDMVSDDYLYVAINSWSGDIYSKDDLDYCKISKDDAELVVTLWS